jgi:uncharacterized protein (UPF0548 family)
MKKIQNFKICIDRCNSRFNRDKRELMSWRAGQKALFRTRDRDEEVEIVRTLMRSEG